MLLLRYLYIYDMNIIWKERNTSGECSMWEINQARSSLSSCFTAFFFFELPWINLFWWFPSALCVVKRILTNFTWTHLREWSEETFGVRLLALKLFKKSDQLQRATDLLLLLLLLLIYCVVYICKNLPPESCWRLSHGCTKEANREGQEWEKRFPMKSMLATRGQGCTGSRYLHLNCTHQVVCSARMRGWTGIISTLTVVH